MKHLIEIFVEKNCRECEQVLLAVSALGVLDKWTIAVYRREKDMAMFRARNVVISPATFIGGTLMFYGSFTRDALRSKLGLN